VEVGGDVSVLEGPLVDGVAAAFADGKDDGVISWGEGVAFAGFGLHREWCLVWAWGEVLDDDSVGQWFGFAAWGEDFDHDLTSSGFVGDGVVEGEGEGSTDGSDLRGGIGTSNVDSTNTVWALSEFLAVEDWIGVNIVENLDEFVDSDNITKEITNCSFGLVGESTAKSSAGSNNTTVGNDFN